MIKDQIMALADEFAAATSNHYLAGERDAIKWQLMVDARAALEAALTEKQEPYAWAKPEEGDYAEAFNWTRNEVYTLPLYTHPAPVNQRIAELEAALDVALEALEERSGVFPGSWSMQADRAVAKLKEVRK